MPETGKKPQLIDPRFPYMEENLNVAVQSTNETISTSDSLIIDTWEKTVKLNGSEIDYNWMKYEVF